MQYGAGAVSWLLVALCFASALYCLTRLPKSTGCRRPTAGTEAVMGLAMAAMAVPGAMAPQWAAAAFTAVFAAIALVALTGALRGVPHGLHHLLEAGAMGYLSLGMTGVSTVGGLPLLTGALLLYFAAHVLRTGAALVTAAAGPASGPPARPALDLSDACRLSLATGTFAMLLTM